MNTLNNRHQQPALPPVHLHQVMKAAALKATPGKYCFSRSGRAVNICALVKSERGNWQLVSMARLPVSMWRNDAQMEADAHFMSVASPDHVLKLVDTIEAREAHIARLEAVISELRTLVQEVKKCV